MPWANNTTQDQTHIGYCSLAPSSPAHKKKSGSEAGGGTNRPLEKY